MLRVPSVMILVACCLAWAVARLRVEPNTMLAPLSHMLISGFFLIQGFFISITVIGAVNRIAGGSIRTVILSLKGA